MGIRWDHLKTYLNPYIWKSLMWAFFSFPSSLSKLGMRPFGPLDPSTRRPNMLRGEYRLRSSLQKFLLPTHGIRVSSSPLDVLIQTKYWICIGPRCPWGPIYGYWCPSITHIHRAFADLADVTLANEDINSIPTNDVNRAIPGIVAMQASGATCHGR